MAGALSGLRSRRRGHRSLLRAVRRPPAVRADRPPGERDRRRPAGRDRPLRRPRRLRPPRGRARSGGRPAAGRRGARRDGRRDRAFDGTREKFIGDAVFAVFGWPRAHDDDALRATLAPSRSATGSRASRTRAGGAAGPDRAGDRRGRRGPARGPGPTDWSLTGPAITTAARIQGLAEPGEILLDEADPTGDAQAAGDRGPRDRGSSAASPARPARPAARRHRVPAVAAARRPVHRPRSGGRGDRPVCALARPLRETGRSGGIARRRRRRDRQVAAPRRPRGRRRAGAASPGPGPRTSRTAGRSRTGSAASLAQSIAEEHAMDSGTFARRLLFTPDARARRRPPVGGAIAAIARDAAFSGWEAEAADMPADPAEVGLDRCPGRRPVHGAPPRDRRPAGHRHRRSPLARPVERRDLRGARRSAPRGRRSSSGRQRPGSRPAWARGTGRRADRPRRPRRAGDRPARDAPSPAPRSTPTTPAASMPGPAATRSSSARPSGRSSTTAPSLDDGRLELAEPPLTGLPVTLRALLGSRIDALSPAGRTVLRVASVIGIALHEPSGSADRSASRRRPPRLERLAEAALIVPADDGGVAVRPPADPRRRLRRPPGTSRRRSSTPGSRTRLEALQRPARSRRSPSTGRPPATRPGRSRCSTRRPTPPLAVGAAAEAAGFWRTAAELVDGRRPLSTRFRDAAGAAMSAPPRGPDGRSRAAGTDGAPAPATAGSRRRR